MRDQLASVGIALDEPIAPAAPAPAARVAHLDVDRERIRQIIVEAGAPEHAIGWMVASCPSVEHALSYRPTVHSAWCAICEAVVDCDDGGCLPCQRICEAAV